MYDEDEMEALRQTIANQGAVLALALETLEGLGFDIDELAAATLD